MACNCHGTAGVKVSRTSPFDQCTTCARKHVKNAWSKWHEFTYEDDNRDYISGQLRDAADHLKFDHREVALQCRDLAVIIEEVKDLEYGNVAEALDVLRKNTLALFYADHPDAAERLAELERKATAGE